MKSKPVLEEGNFALYRRNLKDQRFDLPGVYGDFYIYTLVDKRSNKQLFSIKCQRPTALLDDPRIYIIERIKSMKYGAASFFPRMLEMVRKNIRKEGHARADLVSWGPTVAVEEFFKRVCRARWKDGFLHFPKVTRRRR